MRRTLLILAPLVSACGRIAFDPRTSDDAGADGARQDGARDDGSTPTTLGLATYAQQAAVDVTTLGYPLVIPSDANYLLVSLHIGSNCLLPDPSVATVTGVTYGGVALSRVQSIVGTPCGVGLTRSELWSLVDPPVGASAVTIQLSQLAGSIHSGAFAIRNADTANPIGGVQASSGNGPSASVVIASAPGELAVSFVGEGGMIGSSGQSAIYIDNVNNGFTLNNSAASTAPGTSPTVTMSWNFSIGDEWQLIGGSVR